MTAYGILWLVALIAFVAIECISYQLMSIWMALGAASALIAYGLGADFVVQFVVFIVVSVVLIILTRPLVNKFLNSKNEKTNVDNLIGKQAVVLSEIDNIKGTGTIRLNGIEWSARSDNGENIQEGKVVNVVKVEGVKVIVKED